MAVTLLGKTSSIISTLIKQRAQTHRSCRIWLFASMVVFPTAVSLRKPYQLEHDVRLKNTSEYLWGPAHWQIGFMDSEGLGSRRQNLRSSPWAWVQWTGTDPELMGHLCHWAPASHILTHVPVVEHFLKLLNIVRPKLTQLVSHVLPSISPLLIAVMPIVPLSCCHSNPEGSHPGDAACCCLVEQWANKPSWI